MSSERQDFSRRLAEAMMAKGYEPKPAVLLRLFNSRYQGRSVAFSTVSKWLRGLTLPVQDKLQVLAALFDVEPHVLRFGPGKKRVLESRGTWLAQASESELQLFEAYARLPPAQQRLVRELIETLARRSP